MTKAKEKQMTEAQLDQFEKEHPILTNGSKVGGMSDAAIDAENENPADALPADDIPTSLIKGFVFKPIRVSQDVLDRSTKATGLSNVDVINVALMLLQNASITDLREAISNYTGEKAETLLASLKKK